MNNKFYFSWEGDKELFDAALRGDPAALASPELTAWLAANQDALAHYRTAPQYEYRGMCVPSADDSLIGILLPNLAPMRQLARTAIIDAKVHQASGDVGGAMRDYLDVLSAGAQTSQGMTLIDNLVGQAVQMQAAESLLDTLAGSDADALDYTALAAELDQSYTPTRRVTEVFQGERAMALDFIQRCYEWDPENASYHVSPDVIQQTMSVYELTDSPPLTTIGMGFVLGAVGFDRMISQTNAHYDALTEAASQPYPAAKPALQAIEEQVGSAAFRLQNPVLSMLLPSLSRCCFVATRSDATRQATRLVANLKAYRQQNGVYPDSLDALGDADFTIDPFTGQRFAYQRTGDDFQLYSLGGNGINDGGVHDRSGDSGDLVYWPRPQR